MKRMYLLGGFAFAVILAAGILFSAGTKNVRAEEGKEVTVKGEVLDLFCYFDHAAKGEGHAKCATACLNKGIPAGFLGADGTLYILLGGDHNAANDQVAEYAGKQSEITGLLVNQNGVKALKVKSIKGA